MPDSLTKSDSPWPHRLAVLLVCATFALLVVGALVTTTDAGMAFRDWPTSDGYLMFLLPLKRWFGSWNAFIEHSHRVLASGVGLLTIALAVLLWKRDERRWMRLLGLMAVAGVVFQGVLGGARVLLDERLVAMIHGCVGPAFFALTAALAVFTSCRWRGADKREDTVDGVKLARVATITAGLAYTQLVLGALLRHSPVTGQGRLFQVALVFHLFLAAVLVAHAILLALRVRRLGSSRRVGLAAPAAWLLALLCVQVLLGVGAWVTNYGWPAWFSEFEFAVRHVVVARGVAQIMMTTAHVATGSLVFATALLLTLRCWRFFGRRPAGAAPVGLTINRVMEAAG